MIKGNGINSPLMRKFSPGIEELGKSINWVEECPQHGNYQGNQPAHFTHPFFHLTGFYLIHQLTSNTKQISLQIAQAVMWKWALYLAYNYGMGLQFYYYPLPKSHPKGRSWGKKSTQDLMLNNDTCFSNNNNNKWKMSKIYALCSETPCQAHPWALPCITDYFWHFTSSRACHNHNNAIRGLAFSSLLPRR